MQKHPIGALLLGSKKGFDTASGERWWADTPQGLINPSLWGLLRPLVMGMLLYSYSVHEGVQPGRYKRSSPTVVDVLGFPSQLRPKCSGGGAGTDISSFGFSVSEEWETGEETWEKFFLRRLAVLYQHSASGQLNRTKRLAQVVNTGELQATRQGYFNFKSPIPLRSLS